jgi:hypothetical protein
MDAVDPYPFLNAACGNARVSVTGTTPQPE